MFIDVHLGKFSFLHIFPKIPGSILIKIINLFIIEKKGTQIKTYLSEIKKVDLNIKQ